MTWADACSVWRTVRETPTYRLASLTSALALCLGLGPALLGGSPQPNGSVFRLQSLEGLELVGGKAEVVNYRGRKAVHLLPMPSHDAAGDEILAIVGESTFKDQTIEVEVAGAPLAGSPPDSRGFIGIAFRVQHHGSKFENIYLRPTNGRAGNQLQRNHSVQYASEPDFPWYRLRKENPGMYESYVDLDPGAWTRMKVVVSGTTAKLYVNDAAQPCLIVNDLKLGETSGQVALWAHSSTDAYFSNLTIR